MSGMRMLFVAPWYLLPTDSGGKLRTADILKYLRRNGVHVTLVSPEPETGKAEGPELEAICDRFIGWPQPERGALFQYTRLRHLLSPVPVPVASDRNPAATDCIARALQDNPDVVVVDFIHTDVVMPDITDRPRVVFTHNVEAEIFERHYKVAEGLARRMVWRDQYRKMCRFERDVVRAYDQVVTVSQRDAEIMARDYGLDGSALCPIPTGLDMERYNCKREAAEVPADGGRLVFTATMNSAANVDAINWWRDEVWPLLVAKRPNIAMSVVGKNPPASMVASCKGLNWEFTGFVPSVEPHVHAADVFVIPLRVGGGTRLKVIEAIAMGSPLVSTTLGVEGIDLEAGRHFEPAETPQEFAERIDTLLADRPKREALARDAHEFVAGNFGAQKIAEIFLGSCEKAIAAHATAAAASGNAA